jgi:acetyl esterase/lipase
MEVSSAMDDLSTEIREEGNITSKHAAILVTSRTERSLYTAVLHILVRRIRRFLGQPPKQPPTGSAKLKPFKTVYKTCTVAERIVCDVYMYDIHPRKLSKDGALKRIYYFAGGGWQSPPSSQHWQLCAKLARSMENTAITLVSYPLAPNNAAPSAFPWLLRLYRELMRQADEDGTKVILAGDSSGGNIVLSVVLEALREDDEQLLAGTLEKPMPHCNAIMAISPSTDLTRSNPEIQKVMPRDPFLTPDFINQTAAAWKGDWDAKDPRISPIFADVGLLAKYGIRVHAVTGSYDILSPDALMFRERCEKERVSGEWLEWDKQMHCFPLTWCYGLHEGREAVGWIIDVLKKE